MRFENIANLNHACREIRAAYDAARDREHAALRQQNAEYIQNGHQEPTHYDWYVRGSYELALTSREALQSELDNTIDAIASLDNEACQRYPGASSASDLVTLGK